MEGDNVKNLPYFQPSNEFGIIKVHDAPRKRKDDTRNKALFLARNAVKNMHLNSAWREFLQNMIDAIIEANNGSFAGIKITKHIGDNNVVTITFHTSKYIFGEIIMKKDKITFVNMAPKINETHTMLHFGASEKPGKPNQSGQHGEGLKRAALKFIVSGFKVDAVFAISVDGQTGFRHLTFNMNTKHDCLGYTMSQINARERVKGNNDWHRFEISVCTGTKDVVFDIDSVLIHQSFIRDAKDANDKGSVILDKQYEHRIYVWHFFVCNESRLLYGYDFFLTEISRDRNYISYDVLYQSIGAVWSQQIEQDDAIARLFYNDCLMNHDNEGCLEALSLCHFTNAAAKILLDIFEKEHPLRRPITKEQEHLIDPQFDSSLFYVVPKHTMKLFEKIVGNFTKFIDESVKSFCQLEAVPLVCPILVPALSSFFSSAKVVLSDQKNDQLSCVHYHVSVADKTLYISQHCINNDGTISNFDGLCNLLFFRYRILPIDFNVMELMAYILNWRSVIAVAPSPTAAVVVPEEEEEEKSETDPSDNAVVLHPKKRGREEEALMPAPPDGYEYYNGPPLLVKRKQ